MTTHTRIVLVGAGHAHHVSLKRAHELAQCGSLTVITPGPLWYSGMGPGLLSGDHPPTAAAIDVRDAVEHAGGQFFEQRAVRIDSENRRIHLADDRVVPYDLCSVNTGSRIAVEAIPGANETAIPVKPVENFLRIRDAIDSHTGNNPLRIVIAGGGAAGCETAACADAHARHRGTGIEVTLVHGSEHVLNEFPANAGECVLRILSARNVVVKTGTRVESAVDGTVTLSGGETIAFDLFVAATGVEPRNVFMPSSAAVNERGELIVNEFLQSPRYPDLFGGGDGIHFQPAPLDKVGVYAVRQSPVIHQNLLAAAKGANLQRFKPQKTYLLILNLGDGTGLFVYDRIVFRSRLAASFKHWLDRRFVGSFRASHEKQASGSSNEAEAG